MRHYRAATAVPCGCCCRPRASHALSSAAASFLVPSVLQQPKLARYLETDAPATTAGSAADDGWVCAARMGRLQSRRACLLGGVKRLCATKSGSLAGAFAEGCESFILACTL